MEPFVRNFIRSSLLWLGGGVLLGVWMAVSPQAIIYRPAHVHAKVLEQVRSGRPEVFTDPRASPTGFPFKVVSLPGTNSEAEEYASPGQRKAPTA